MTDLTTLPQITPNEDGFERSDIYNTNSTRAHSVNVLELVLLITKAAMESTNCIEKRNMDGVQQLSPNTVQSIRDWKAEALQELNAYILLEDGWDGEDGISPNPKTIRYISELLYKLPNNNRLVPMVSGDGEIGLFFNSEELSFTLSAWDGDLLECAVLNKNTGKSRSFECTNHSKVNEEIYSQLS